MGDRRLTVDGVSTDIDNVTTLTQKLIHLYYEDKVPPMSYYTVIHNYRNPWFLLNNSVKHWPIMIIFGMQHYKEIWRKWL